MTQLEDRLRERIRAEGPLTFAAFMEAALYDEEQGFYAGSPIGEGGDFVTSPHVSGVFGTLLAAQIAQFWELLGSPARFDLVEAGAGTGLLARQILQNLPSDLRDRLRYHALERSSSAREAIRTTVSDLGAVVEVGSDLGEVGTGLVGCLIANELLDNLPFHRVRGTVEGIVELFVAFESDRFILVEGPPSDPRVERSAPPLARGEEAVVGLRALEFLERASRVFERGYLWLCDYGWSSRSAGDVPGSAGSLGSPGSTGLRIDYVHGYHRHRVEEDVLVEPGSRDITAGIDFGALRRHGESLGLRTWGPVSQRDALLALGFYEWSERARGRQVRATADRDGLEAMRIYSERNRASQLVDPLGLGGFLVLCMGAGEVSDQAPRSMAGAG